MILPMILPKSELKLRSELLLDDSRFLYWTKKKNQKNSKFIRVFHKDLQTEQDLRNSKFVRNEFLEKTLPKLIKSFCSEAQKIHNKEWEPSSLKKATAIIRKIRRSYFDLVKDNQIGMTRFKSEVIKVLSPYISAFFSKIRNVENPPQPFPIACLRTQLDKDKGDLKSFLKNQNTKIGNTFASNIFYLRMEILRSKK